MAKGTCSVDGCDRPVLCRGWCQKHYARWHRRGGDPSVRLPTRPPAGFCTIEGCGGEVVGRGWCVMHYARWRKWGDPTIVKNLIGFTTEERFWPYVDKHGPVPEYCPRLGPCWIWLAGTIPSGYGSFGRGGGGNSGVAHRFAYELLVGPIPEGLDLDHLCYVTLCVNPTHLDPVTRSENVRRQWEHWRWLRSQ